MTNWPRGGYPAGDTPASELKPPPANMISKQSLEAATYTAAEVKVLTETASKVALELGRREAFKDAIAYQVHIDGEWVSFHPSDVRVAFMGDA